MKIDDLIGKTITSAKQMQATGYDDKGYIKLVFSDGSECVIVAGYDCFSEGSLYEYPTCIDILSPVEIEEDLTEI